MAIGLDTTAANIKPLEGAIVRPVVLGTTVVAGTPITLQSDGYWDPTDASTAQLTVAVAVQGGVAGDRVDAVFFGPVQCVTGGTPGAQAYASDDAGAWSETVGTKHLRIGFVLNATTVFVQPQIIDWS